MFLAAEESDVGPRLLDWDDSDGLAVFEDLGRAPTLETLLWDAAADDAVDGLMALARSLAGLHTTGRGSEQRFGDCQIRLGVRSPRSDSTSDQRDRMGRFETSSLLLGVGIPQGFADDLQEIERLVHDDHRFRSLIHADAGPQNLLYAGNTGNLIDMEFAIYGNVLCDVVGPRLGFPQTMMPAEVPPELVGRFESTYRELVVPAFVEFGDLDIFTRGLTAAAGHWALNRWSSAWDDSAPPDRQTAEVKAALSRNHLVMDGFVGLASEQRLFSAASEAVGRLMENIREESGLSARPVYPALQE